MTPRGPDPSGGGPEDPEGGGDERLDPDEQLVEGPGGDAPRGWLPPEDRLWRHPSEVLAGGVPESGSLPPYGVVRPASGSTATAAGRRTRHHRVTNTLVGTGAAAAVLAGMVLLLNAGAGPGGYTTDGASRSSTSLTAVTACCRVVPVSARAAQSSLVSLLVTTGRGTTVVCGVAVAPGGEVATTFDAVDGAHAITAVTAGGRHERASVVATDRTSDVALVRIAGNPPPARFAGAPTMAPGGSVMVMAMAAGTGTTRSSTVWASTTVRSVGVTVPAGSAAGMAGIETAAPPMPAVAGALLVQPDGRVAGILDASSPGVLARGDPVFLPSQLVVGVAVDLAGSAAVRHGWLDVEGTNAPATAGPGATRTPGGPGALVVKVVPGGAATGILRAGDVIRTLQGLTVGTMAELRSRLYVLRPGTRVALGIVRAGSPRTVAVTLSASP